MCSQTHNIKRFEFDHTFISNAGAFLLHFHQNDQKAIAYEDKLTDLLIYSLLNNFNYNQDNLRYGSIVMTKKLSTKSGLLWLLSAKARETLRVLLVDKNLLNDINPPLVFLICF